MEPRGRHVPVLLERCLELLAPALDRQAAVHVDATLGLGGHAEAVLQAHPHIVLIGLDRDPEALAHAGKRLESYRDRTHLAHAVYDELPRVLAQLGYDKVDSILFDLGVSSLQLDEADRGFAYAQDAPLDMRMDQTTGITAAEVLNGYTVADLTRVLRVYGEEKFASRIAAAIGREREKAPLTSSARLAELVRESIPAPARRTGGHPAKRTFQALRIEVNGELSTWERALPDHQTGLRGPCPQHGSDRFTRRAARDRSHAEALDPGWGGAAQRVGDRAQPESRLGALARGRAD